MAVRALLHYALEVPDQTVGEKFYTGFGLVGDGRGDDAVHLRPASLKRDAVMLYGGPKKRLHHVAFGAPGMIKMNAAWFNRTRAGPWPTWITSSRSM